VRLLAGEVALGVTVALTHFKVWRIDSGGGAQGQLTYMSIEEIIGYRVQQQMLFPLEPRAPGTTARRAMRFRGNLGSSFHNP
jgi:hypothetical protein